MNLSLLPSGGKQHQQVTMSPIPSSMGQIRMRSHQHGSGLLSASDIRKLSQTRLDSFLFCYSALLLTNSNKIQDDLPPSKTVFSLQSSPCWILLGGMLTACGGGGGGVAAPQVDRAATRTETAAVESVLYSINKGSSDYHQAFDLSASTTYYWKVVATDTQDPNLTYESEVRILYNRSSYEPDQG